MEPATVELRFSATHSRGALRLRVPRPSASATAAGAAIALDQCDDLLQALDDWLEAELDWRWEEAERPSGSSLAQADFVAGDDGRRDLPDTVPSASAFASAPASTRAASARTRCRLEVSWPLMRTIGMPPPTLAACLRWQDTPALLTLARLILDPLEQAAIEPGGAVLLPGSMQADWKAWLHLPEEMPEQGLAVSLEGPVPMRSASVASPPPAPPLPDEGREYEVRLALSRPLQPSLLAGWRDPAPVLGVLDARQAELWISQPRSGGQSRLLAQGRLIPWGHGWAMLVDGLH